MEVESPKAHGRLCRAGALFKTLVGKNKKKINPFSATGPSYSLPNLL